MTRSAKARAFGFRAEGIIRVLEGADPREVKLALEALGLRIQDEQGLLQRLLGLVGGLLGPFGDIFIIVDTVREVISAFVDPALDLIEELTSANSQVESIERAMRFALSVMGPGVASRQIDQIELNNGAETLRQALTTASRVKQTIESGSNLASLAIAPAGELVPQAEAIERTLEAEKVAFQDRLEAEARAAVAPSTEFL